MPPPPPMMHDDDGDDPLPPPPPPPDSGMNMNCSRENLAPSPEHGMSLVQQPTYYRIIRLLNVDSGSDFCSTPTTSTTSDDGNGWI